jgi:hypothetical protein
VDYFEFSANFDFGLTFVFLFRILVVAAAIDLLNTLARTKNLHNLKAFKGLIVRY